ncbi:ankyrin repeat domain-containing protein [Wolbachia endosymbiont (group A) of Andrena hattorfiana]|uniref:ankyrin repeat domain-containing protein n=1 Tax=Wolbachia endosymbiont (group A) of Andrena hattorfiana TaxID=2953977 RepID=UPI0021F85061|nr:ankyrin repeat domain-containing protein [Wolbachia endosymbiont (group A) of Andrena hattorfiana]
MLKKGVYENEDRYTKTVLTTWNITMTYICKEYGFEALSILEIMAYLAPDNIRIKEIFSKLITNDKAKLWNAVELLNRYSMIKLREGVVNIHRLVQEVTRLKLQENRQEEKTLRKALELINSGDLAKDSKIHVASIWGYASKHGRLIDDFYKDTNLHLLVENDDYKAIKNLLAYIKKKHQDKLSEIVNAKDGCDIAPLHLAAGNGKLDIVKYLINKGASIDSRDCFYQTPLYWAAKSGELDMVKYLVNKGASVDIEDSYGRTALYWAVENENFYIAEYLIKEKGIDVSARYSNGKTMLHEAIRFAKLDAVRYLIGKGIDIDIKDGYGGAPLHWAAIRGKIDMVRYFIEQGADVNAKDNDDLTSLHWAVLYANLKVVRCLVEDGSDVDAKDKRGWTPLHLIAKNNRLLWGDDLNEMLGTTEYFIQKGADVNAKDKDGNTPLHLAAMKGKIDVVKILLEYNADVNTKNNEGRTALYYAANNNHQELVELLLAHGASRDY